MVSFLSLRQLAHLLGLEIEDPQVGGLSIVFTPADTHN